MKQNARDKVIVLLASGLSTRFANGDKLLANLQDKPILKHVIDALKEIKVRKIVVIGTTQYERKRLFKNSDWEIVENSSPEDGQGSSLAIAVRHIIPETPSKLMVCLSDMPFIPKEHYQKLLNNTSPNLGAAFTSSLTYKGPPAIFSGDLLPFLQTLSGDEGARRILPKGTALHFIEVPQHQTIDIDTQDDLEPFQPDHS